MLSPAEEEKHLMPASCRTSAPRGIYNMGQTCYMSVIVQAMTHNPLMRNHLLGRLHLTENCETTCKDSRLTCAFTKTLTEMLMTDEIVAFSPANLLFVSWVDSLALGLVRALSSLPGRAPN